MKLARLLILVVTAPALCGCFTSIADYSTRDVGVVGETLKTADALLIADDGAIAVGGTAAPWDHSGLYRRYALFPPGTLQHLVRNARNTADSPYRLAEISVGSQPSMLLVGQEPEHGMLAEAPAARVIPAPGEARHATSSDLPPRFNAAHRVPLKEARAVGEEQYWAAVFEVRHGEEIIEIAVHAGNNALRTPNGHIMRGVALSAAIAADVITSPIQLPFWLLVSAAAIAGDGS